MPAAPSRLELADLKGHRFISVASSGPIGEIFVCEQQRLGLALDNAISTRTFFIATALVRAGVGLTVVHGPASRISARPARSEEHTSELQSLMRLAYAVF